MLGVKNGYPVVPWALVLTSITIRGEGFIKFKSVTYCYFIPPYSAW